MDIFKPPLGQTIFNGVMTRTCDNIWPGAVTFGNGIHDEMIFTKEECLMFFCLNYVKWME